MPPAPLSTDRRPHPGPHQDQATTTAAKPSRAARLLSLVRKLIDYGKAAAHTLQQRAAEAHPHLLALHFDTADIPLILARFARGLRLAAALEARLISHPPQENPPTPVNAAPNAAAKRPQRTARPPPRPASPAVDDPRLAALPTAEELAAAIRRRPIGAVLANICRDLGITTGHPLWRELDQLIMQTGGNVTRLMIEILHRGDDWMANSPLAKVPFDLSAIPPEWTPPYHPPTAANWCIRPP